MRNIAKIGVVIMIFLLGACINDNENISNQLLKIKSSSDKKCKKFASVVKTGEVVAANRTCVEYQYNNNVLNLKHINAGFNCEPSELFATVKLVADTIVIEEHEASNGAKCLCLYDLDLEVSQLSLGEYVVKFVELYAEKQEQLLFKIDLLKATTGSFCVKRNVYPWKDD